MKTFRGKTDLLFMNKSSRTPPFRTVENAVIFEFDSIFRLAGHFGLDSRTLFYQTIHFAMNQLFDFRPIRRGQAIVGV